MSPVLALKATRATLTSKTKEKFLHLNVFECSGKHTKLVRRHSVMLIASRCLQGRLERWDMQRRVAKARPTRKASNRVFSINKTNPWPFLRRRLCRLHPWTQFCMQTSKTFQMHIKVDIERHSQMHLVIFHYFIGQLHSRLLYMMFISSNHLDCALHTLSRTEERQKIFHSKEAKKKFQWICTWLEKGSRVDRKSNNSANSFKLLDEA